MACDKCPCRLNLLTPSGKSGKLKKILSHLLRWFDPDFDLVTISERYEGDEVPSAKLKEKEDGRLVTPCLSVMLFVRERGIQSYKDYLGYLRKDPWIFHHMVELQSTSSPELAVGRQEFYKLDDGLPLWAVCPSHEERLRLNLYVSRYREMVEFYRAVTEVEMESSKPEFCIFQLHQQPGLVLQLSLKHSPFLFPVAVESSCLSFFVRNVRTVRAGTNCLIEEVEDGVYTTHDPDGNLVILYETPYSVDDEPGADSGLRRRLRKGTDAVEDSKSLKSSSDSHDSGRCSDLEATVGEMDMLQKNQKHPTGKLKKGPNEQPNSNFAKGKPPTKTTAESRPSQEKGQSTSGKGGKGQAVVSNKSSSAQSKEPTTKETTEGADKRKNITPVYI